MSKCENCGNDFEQPNKYRDSKTCSRECRYALSGKSNRQAQGAQYLDRECPQCGATFDGKTTHCSRECSNKARSGDKHPAVRALRERGYPSCSACGEPTQHSQRTTCPEHRRGQTVRDLATCPCGQPAENIRSKYCGPEHRKQWGKKSPAKMITKTCLGCGNEFTRPHYFPGKLKYCSNACAHRQVKKVRDKYILDLPVGAVVFHSGYEIRFIAVCERFDIPWRSYDGPDIDTPVGTYRPDFIVTIMGRERIVEVKGWEERPGTDEKFQAALAAGHDVLMIPRPTLLYLEQHDQIEAHNLLGLRLSVV